MKHSNDFYDLEITKLGLMHLTVGGEVVMDRGALHEFLDLSERVEDDDGTGDRQRQVHHHIQLYRDAELERAGDKIVATGQLETEQGAGGVMSFKSTWTVNDGPGILLEVLRVYQEDVDVSGDDSICFLSPGGFAKTFHIFSPQGGYMVRGDDEKAWAPHQVSGDDAHATTEIPVRLKAPIKESGYGAIMGERVGFGLVVQDYKLHPSPQRVFQTGELRATRPRPPNADKKFDEVEFQWAPASRRLQGTIERATFLIVPCHGSEFNVVGAYTLQKGEQ
jgi:hypothetical protein